MGGREREKGSEVPGCDRAGPAKANSRFSAGRKRRATSANTFILALLVYASRYRYTQFESVSPFTAEISAIVAPPVIHWKAHPETHARLSRRSLGEVMTISDLS